MAHGFRHVPKRRTASPPDADRCPFCHARLRGMTVNLDELDDGADPDVIGQRPHFCKETTYGTAGSFLQTIFADAERLDGPPYEHKLVMPVTEEEMRAQSPAAFTFSEESE